MKNSKHSEDLTKILNKKISFWIRNGTFIILFIILITIPISFFIKIPLIISAKIDVHDSDDSHKIVMFLQQNDAKLITPGQSIILGVKIIDGRKRENINCFIKNITDMKNGGDYRVEIDLNNNYLEFKTSNIVEAKINAGKSSIFKRLINDSFN